MTEQDEQLTKPTYEELARAVLLFYYDDPQAVWRDTVDALNDCGERLEANQEAKDEPNN